MKKRKKIKILSILLSMAMVMSMLVIQNPVTVSAVENEPDSVVNLVLNPDFDNGLTSWVNYVAPSNAAAEFKVVNDQNMSGVNALNAVITNGGTNTGHIQLKQKSLKLESGETYILSFLAKADSSKNVPINIKATTSPYTIFLSQTINLNNELKTFEYTMEIPGDKGQLINTDLIFNFGGSANSGSNIYLDKFILAKVVPGVFPKTNTYYVDSVAGDDANDGLSEETAWSSLSKVNVTTFKAGDKILLKAGAVWTGTLFPQGSGTKGNPINIDMYGEGNKPIINGNGKAYTKEDIVDAAVYLRNQDYWTIRNLELTNASPTPDVRSGIHVDATSGNHAGITIENCYVHDVASDGNRSSHGSIAAISVLSRTFSASF
ncbi:MAG: hypothetical protein K0R31_1848, partial [Clostridiales bacterium]|nr:hypothetical protein [Clostridiales bacterium]